MSKFEAPKNRAFLFIKPNAATPAMEKLVEATLAAKGIKILKKGVIDGPTIDAKRLIDQHYYAIASKATLLKPSELPVPEDKFQEFFGVSFQDAIAQGTAVNALEACKKLDCTPDELRAEWRAVCKSGDMIKFGGGFYCGKIKGLQIFNPFFMAMRAVYTASTAKLIYFDVEFDQQQLSWAAFRGEVLGPTDPVKAPSGSLRRLALERWEALGHDQARVAALVRNSATQLEKLAEERASRVDKAAATRKERVKARLKEIRSRQMKHASSAQKRRRQSEEQFKACVELMHQRFAVDSY